MAMKKLRTLALAGMLAGMTASGAHAQAYQGYVLGPDDSIQVIVYGQPDAGISTRIKADGTIVMPLIGTVQASGLTNIALARLVADRLSQGGFLKSPVVNVEIANYVSKSVNVAGRVGAPAIVPLDRPYRALDVLLKTGWIAPTGASYVLLRRPGAPEMRLETEGLVRGDPDKNPLLKDGDTLFVPDADQFFVSGQINKAGSFPIVPGMTVRQALAIAGGVTATGSTGKVGLIRGGAKEVDADLSTVIQKNDVIVVRERLF
jgi:polysaccharide export outer membrane protein